MGVKARGRMKARVRVRTRGRVKARVRAMRVRVRVRVRKSLRVSGGIHGMGAMNQVDSNFLTQKLVHMF